MNIMNIKYQVGKDDELKCSKEEQENNKENEKQFFVCRLFSIGC